MRCLFCKQNSSSAKSIEHIIPESLGNKEHVLPLGYICDKCNNYFAREVEKPFLEQLDIKLLRFQERIPSKKNKIPMITGMLNERYPVLLKRYVDNDMIKIIVPEKLKRLIEDDEQKKISVVAPAFTNENRIESTFVVSRFLAKIALEALAVRVISVEGSLEALVDDIQFDPIRNHARLGTTKDWPCSIRRIYNMEKSWEDDDGITSQVIHEFDFLLSNCDDIEDKKVGFVYAITYFVFALLGMEFAINIAEPEIHGYQQWLYEHDNISPLYYESKNDEFIM
jgi:hypothetical protein